MKNIISIKSFSNFSILLIFLAHFCSLSASKNITLSETYYYGKDLSENKACEIALNNAKKKAVNSLGETITSDTILQCKESNTEESCKQFSNIWTESAGVIKSFTNKREIGYNNSLNSYFCRQILNAEVVKSQKPDPNFDFDVKLNKNVFQIDSDDINKENNLYASKDSLEIIISPLSKMYLNIFYYAPLGSRNLYNEKITRLFPNAACAENYIQSDIIIPNSVCKILFKLTYSKDAFVIENNKQEFLLLIATKNKIKFKHEYTIKELKEKINEISNFEIRKKDMTINVYFNK
tara:strand:- start:4152 stop:5030 length:879 start_codon:yes stop_codon:yes gene_type:complete